MKPDEQNEFQQMLDDLPLPLMIRHCPDGRYFWKWVGIDQVGRSWSFVDALEDALTFLLSDYLKRTEERYARTPVAVQGTAQAR